MRDLFKSAFEEMFKSYLRWYLLSTAASLLLILAIMIPNLLRGRVSANEASVVQSLRSANQAARSYRTSHGAFPASLEVIGPAGAFSIDAELASGRKSGYVFRYEARDTDGDGFLDSYRIHASPIGKSFFSQRYFFTDETGIIRMESDDPATAESPIA